MTLRLPEIGRVKLGQKGQEIVSKKGNKFQPPEKLDYFKIVTLTRGADNNFEVDARAHEILGEKPRCLVVRPISGKPEENVQDGYALYSKGNGSRLCHGDGSQGIDDQTGEVKKCPCIEFENGACKRWARTSFFLDKVGGVGGVHTMTIRGRITVPVLIDTMRYIAGICESAGTSVAGVPLELRLNEVTTKYGKVYSPFFFFPGTAEALIAAAKSSMGGQKFRVLADETDEADDTEDPVEPEPAATPDINPDPALAAKNDPAPQTLKSTPSATEKGEPDVSTDKPAENMAPVADAPADAPATTEKTEPAKSGKKVKAFWCDSCFRIINDYAAPGVCKCGQTKFHDAVDMKAAQEAITKLRNENIEKKTDKKPAEKTSFFWCVECGAIVESATKPANCGCGASHFSVSVSREAAEKAFQDRKVSGDAKTSTEKNTALNVIASRIKAIFGSSAPAAICKQISLLLDRQVESSEQLNVGEIKELLEATEILEGLQKKSDRDQFIADWKAARGA